MVIILSSYEEYILKILKSNNIKFIREATFSDCRGGKYRFDFYLKDRNILLEIDGQYHFQPIRGEKNLRAQKERDRRKNSYALSRKIQLYRIPYWEINKVKEYGDIVSQKFLVESKYHNDLLKIPK